MPRVLIIEDDKDGSRSVTEAVQDAGFEAVAVMTGGEGVHEFASNPFDVVLSDLVLPDIDGIEVLSRIRKINDSVPVLIMTAYGSVASSIKAIKAGAYDYILKPLDLDDLQSKISRAHETMRLRREVNELKETVAGRYSIHAMVVKSRAMKEVVRQVEAVADSNATVLVLGESGVGKELVARAMHADSRRRTGPFVAVNCGAFSENLLESELFGHEKGAFTGAASRHAGAFERADGGTLFLDEIGVAPLSVQVKLLRVLEEREIMRVGGQETLKVNVRVVSATNRELDDLVAEGEFREDLLYRLKVVAIRIPPLRERTDDIRPLVDRFVAAACEDHGRHISTVDPGAYALLEKHSWPGNVRQLRNVVESSVVMAKGETLSEDDILLETSNGENVTEFSIPPGMTLAELEREAFLASLRRNNGNRSLTADELGISRRTIQRKIKEHNLPF